MNAGQLIKILVARKWFVIFATLASVCGALFVVLFLPPRWEAHSRVLLGDLKQDPITGIVDPSTATETYIATQVELVTDYSVAGRVAQQLGWLSDPQLIQLYNNRPSTDDRDYSRWLAQLIINRTRVNVLPQTNIMEIICTSNTPDSAKVIADALRQAYIDQSVAFRSSEALKTAAFFDAEAQKAKALLDTASVEEADYERANGVVMQDDDTDLETARLRALASADAPPISASERPAPSAAAAELAQLDASIAGAEKTLGPNHPDLVAMKGRRAALAAVAARDQSRQSSVGEPATASGLSVERAVQAQKSRVLAQSGKIGRLQQLHANVNLWRLQLNNASARAEGLRRQAAVNDTGIVPLGEANLPANPSFPNLPLIFAGALALGLGNGALASILGELMARRVRGPADLNDLTSVPLIAVVKASKRHRRLLPAGLGLRLGRVANDAQRPPEPFDRDTRKAV